MTPSSPCLVVVMQFTYTLIKQSYKSFQFIKWHVAECFKIKEVYLWIYFEEGNNVEWTNVEINIGTNVDRGGKCQWGPLRAREGDRNVRLGQVRSG